MPNSVEAKETGREGMTPEDSSIRTNENAVNKSKTMPKGVKQELTHKQRVIETK